MVKEDRVTIRIKRKIWGLSVQLSYMIDKYNILNLKASTKDFHKNRL